MPMGHCKICGFTHALSEEELCFSCEKNVLVAELRARCEKAERERDDARLVNQVVNYPGMASVVHRLAEAEGLLRRTDCAVRIGDREYPREVEAFLANRPTSSAPANPPTCVWREDEWGAYRTSCGHVRCYMVGGPKEDVALFCQYCGKKLLAHQPLDTPPKLE